MSFMSCPDSVRGNSCLAKDVVARCPTQFAFCSHEIRLEKATALLAVTGDGTMLQYCFEELRADKDVVGAALKASPQAARFVSLDVLQNPQALLPIKGRLQFKNLHPYAKLCSGVVIACIKAGVKGAAAEAISNGTLAASQCQTLELDWGETQLASKHCVRQINACTEYTTTVPVIRAPSQIGGASYVPNVPPKGVIVQKEPPKVARRRGPYFARPPASPAVPIEWTYQTQHEFDGSTAETEVYSSED